MEDYIEMAAEEIGMFCRMQMYTKRELPIRTSEMGLLIFVSKQKDEVTPLKISQFFRIAKPSVTGMINELLKSGYLLKVPSATDGRSYFVAMTEKGKNLVISAGTEYFKEIAILQKKMGKESFNSLIQLISQANKLMHEEG